MKGVRLQLNRPSLVQFAAPVASRAEVLRETLEDVLRRALARALTDQPPESAPHQGALSASSSPGESGRRGRASRSIDEPTRGRRPPIGCGPCGRPVRPRGTRRHGRTRRSSPLLGAAVGLDLREDLVADAAAGEAVGRVGRVLATRGPSARRALRTSSRRSAVRGRGRRRDVPPPAVRGISRGPSRGAGRRVPEARSPASSASGGSRRRRPRGGRSGAPGSQRRSPLRRARGSAPRGRAARDRCSRVRLDDAPGEGNRQSRAEPRAELGVELRLIAAEPVIHVDREDLRPRVERARRWRRKTLSAPPLRATATGVDGRRSRGRASRDHRADQGSVAAWPRGGAGAGVSGSRLRFGVAHDQGRPEPPRGEWGQSSG